MWITITLEVVALPFRIRGSGSGSGRWQDGEMLIVISDGRLGNQILQLAGALTAARRDERTVMVGFSDWDAAEFSDSSFG